MIYGHYTIAKTSSNGGLRPLHSIVYLKHIFQAKHLTQRRLLGFIGKH